VSLLISKWSTLAKCYDSLPTFRGTDAEVSKIFEVEVKAYTYSYYTLLYVCGTIVGFAGVAFIGLNFFPIFEAPS